MRLFSTPESVREEEISFLAVVETLVAMAISVFIAIKIGTLKHLAVSACIAPFLLLRTEQSTRMAMAWAIYLSPHYFEITDSFVRLIDRIIYNDFLSYIDPHYYALTDSFTSLIERIINQGFSSKVIKYLLIAIVVILAAAVLAVTVALFGVSLILIRMVSMLLILIQNPLTTLSAIPKNWRRATLCVDVVHPPEILPGSEAGNIPKELEFLRGYGPLAHIYKGQDLVFYKELEEFLRARFGSVAHAGQGWLGTAIITLAFAPIIIALWYIPAISYRWSLKSTALIWSPLFWVITPARSNLIIRMKYIRHGVFYKVMRAYSLIIAILLLGKLYILWSWHEIVTEWPSWPKIAEIWTKIPKTHVLYAYVAPPEIPIWQLAAFLNTVLAWVTFFIADLLLLRYGENQPLHEEIPHNVFRGLEIIRNALSLYMIVCTLYITVSLSMEGKWNLPPLGTKLFPWW
jgi:hypothetical protein